MSYSYLNKCCCLIRMSACFYERGASVVQRTAEVVYRITHMTLNRRSLSELALRDIERQPLSRIDLGVPKTRTLTPRATFTLEHP